MHLICLPAGSCSCAAETWQCFATPASLLSSGRWPKRAADRFRCRTHGSDEMKLIIVNRSDENTFNKCKPYLFRVLRTSPRRTEKHHVRSQRIAQLQEIANNELDAIGHTIDGRIVLGHFDFARIDVDGDDWII